MASDEGLSAMAVTFDRHPKEVVSKDFAPSLLTTQAEKLSLLSESFKGEIVVLPFTQELCSLTAKEFMQSVLREKMNAKILLMGYNHRFGHGGGTLEEYVAWGREADIEVRMARALEGEKVSSSRIRNLIAEGNVEKANTLLGYRYFMTGSIVEGKQIGRQIGFPTANLSLPKQKLLPACGVYAVGVEMTNGTRKSGMLCIGHRPTVEANGELSIEVHIFDFDGNLYGKELRLEFIGRLREERRFSSLEELQLQLRRDAADAQALTDKMP